MAAPPDDEARADDEPDAWAEADRRWEEARTGEPVAPEDVPPFPERHEPLPPPPGVVNAYGDGMREAGPYLSLGPQIAGGMALFIGAGYLLDRAAGTSPWGIIVGAVLAFIAMIALVVRLSNQAGSGKKK